MEELKVGDTVRHKSNNKITMVISEIRDNDYLCEWFDESGDYKNRLLKKATVTKVTIGRA